MDGDIVVLDIGTGVSLIGVVTWGATVVLFNVIGASPI